MTIPPSRYNLTAAIVDTLGKAITSGQPHALHFPLREHDLSKQFGVSRSTVREAIKMLAAKGLLTSRRRVGTSVTSHQNWRYLDPDILQWTAASNASLSLLQELTELRGAIEPDAATLASTASTKGDINRLYVAFDAIRTGKSGAQRLAAKIAFHQVILSASGNRFFLQTTTVMQTALKLEEELLPGSDTLLQRHIRRELMLAIGESNPVAASKVMRLLIDSTLRMIQAQRGSGSQ